MRYSELYSRQVANGGCQIEAPIFNIPGVRHVAVRWLDISMKTKAICVLNSTGRILLETMVDTASIAAAIIDGTTGSIRATPWSKSGKAVQFVAYNCS